MGNAYRYTADERKRLTKLRRRVLRARQFPGNTCPASRHLHMMADYLSGRTGRFVMLQEEPDHCAESIYSVLASLWEARAELAMLRRELSRAALGRKA